MLALRTERSLSTAARRVGLLGLLIGVCFIGPGCGKGNDATAPSGSAAYTPDVATGKATYMIACVNCHGPTGGGLPHNGAPLTTSPFVASHTDAELAKFIKEGRVAWAPDNKSGVTMPPNGNVPGGLDEDRLLDVVAYLRQIQANAKAHPATAVPATAPAVSPAH